MSNNPHLTVAAIIEQDGRYLLVEEQHHSKQVINQPAGHWEPGETLIEAVIRETLEETKFHFTPDYITGIYFWTNPSSNSTYLRVAFAGQVSGPDHNYKLDQGIIRTLWCKQEELQHENVNLRTPLVLQCIDDYKKGNRYELDLLSTIV